MKLLFVLLAAALAVLRPAANAQEGTGLIEVPLAAISDRSFGSLGTAALGIRPSEWKHAESVNFVYHYFHSFTAAPASVEAEFYYKIVARELEKETARWQRKCHIYIFEKAQDWAEFQRKGSLDPWTGGMFSGHELFVVREPERKFKGSTLGHEITHLVLHRFFGPGIPLWLNEGYAEYAASRGYAAFHRARGYSARPVTNAVAPERFIPLSQLTAAAAYPVDSTQVETFYNESERLVRFLNVANKAAFLGFLDALSKGARTDSALAQAFGSRFPGLEALDREFKSYATKDYGAASSD